MIPPEFDSMIAKVIVWGHDRDEARARLQRTLLDLAVVVRGGMTNKSFLLELLARPEVVSGQLDTGWLDRSSVAELSPDRGLGPVAVAAAAIDAYEAEADLELARFFASASRGRPETRRDLGQDDRAQPRRRRPTRSAWPRPARTGGSGSRSTARCSTS